MFCVHCGNQVPEDSIVCPECGTYAQADTWSCPSCGQENPATALFCSECGMSVKDSVEDKSVDADIEETVANEVVDKDATEGVAEETEEDSSAEDPSEDAAEEASEEKAAGEEDSADASADKDEGVEDASEEAAAETVPLDTEAISSESTSPLPSVDAAMSEPAPTGEPIQVDAPAPGDASASAEASSASVTAPMPLQPEALQDDAPTQATRKRNRIITGIASGAAVLAVVCVIGVMAVLQVGPFAAPEAVAFSLEEVEEGPWKDFLGNNVDTDHSGAVSVREAEAVVVISSEDGHAGIDGLGIPSLPFLDAFTNLETLSCNGNALTNLDVSHNTKLKNLSCSGNKLTSLDVSNNTDLKQVDCSDNAIPSLDLSANTQLESVDCSNNQMTDLKVPEGDSLSSLHATGNDLSEVDLSQSSNLSDAQLDTESAVVGDPIEDASITNPVQDMVLLFYLGVANGNALSAEDLSEDTEIALAAGELPDQDRGLIFETLATSYGVVLAQDNSEAADNANAQGAQMQATSKVSEVYDFGYEPDYSAADPYLTVPDEAVRKVLSSYYGSCPDDLSYLSDPESPLHFVYNGDEDSKEGNNEEDNNGEANTWSMGYGTTPVAVSATSSEWKSYGSFVSGTVVVETVGGTLGDTYETTFNVTAVKDDQSVFGYHLDSIEYVSGEQTFDPETFDYYGYMTDQLTQMGLAEDVDGFELWREDDTEIMVRGYRDFPDHVAMVNTYVMDKATRQIYEYNMGDGTKTPL